MLLLGMTPDGDAGGPWQAWQVGLLDRLNGVCDAVTGVCRDADAVMHSSGDHYDLQRLRDRITHLEVQRSFHIFLASTMNIKVLLSIVADHD